MRLSDAVDKVCDAPDIWRVRMPFANLASGQSNCYIVSCGGEWLLVDTGAASLAGRAILVRAFCALGVDFSACRVFLTHMHFDHAEMARFVLPARTRVYASSYGVRAQMPDRRADAQRRFYRLMRAMGADADDARGYTACNAETAFVDPALFDVRCVGQGDALRVGDEEFRVIATPGHTPDHLCLFSPKRRIVFSGDIALDGATPSIDAPLSDSRAGFCTGENDPYSAYLDSLSHATSLGAAWAFPGHGAPLDAAGFSSCAAAARAKKAAKLERAWRAVAEAPDCAGEDVARALATGRGARAWGARRGIERYYAMMEACVMLCHLIACGRVSCDFDDDTDPLRFRAYDCD